MKTYDKFIHRQALVGAITLGFMAGTVQAELPASPHQAEVVADAEVGKKIWHETLKKMPVTSHQSAVLRDFVSADADADGKLTREEFEFLIRARADHVASYYDSSSPSGNGMMHGARDNITAYAMLSLDEQYGKADRNADGSLAFHEVYYFETFDRPGMFPTKPDSVPQKVSGHWEMLTVGEHGQVYHQAPFSPDKHRQAIEEGGFTAVDDNDDGVVSIFEASDYSMLTWTSSVRAYDLADGNDDGLLDEKEFSNFQAALAQAPEQAERPGQFPSGKQ